MTCGLSRYSEKSLACLGNANKDNNDNSSSYGGSACLSTVLGA